VAGGRIIFQVNTTLYSVAVHGGKPKPIAFPSCGSPNYLQCGPEAFILSPTREYAAVTTDDGEGNPPPPELIALLKLKPGHVPVELQTPINAEEQGGGYSDVILSFSPHGRQLVFRRDAADCPLPPIPPCSTPPGTGLMAFRLGGGAPVPLAQSGLPGASLVPSDAQRVQWSPDGRWVAFVEHQSLEAVPTTGASAPRVLATNFDSFAVPVNDFSWSPTSKLIAYDCCFNQATRQFMRSARREDGRQARADLNGLPTVRASSSWRKHSVTEASTSGRSGQTATTSLDSANTAQGALSPGPVFRSDPRQAAVSTRKPGSPGRSAGLFVVPSGQRGR
jgi:hypothetical protein